MSYICVSDRYDIGGSVYESPEEFLRMCKEVFGITPNLYEQNGSYYEFVVTRNYRGDWQEARRLGLGSAHLILIEREAE